MTTHHPIAHTLVLMTSLTTSLCQAQTRTATLEYSRHATLMRSTDHSWATHTINWRATPMAPHLYTTEPTQHT